MEFTTPDLDFANRTSGENETLDREGQIEQHSKVAVYGLEDYRFDLIHITGLISLSISISVSVSVLCFLNYPCRQSLWSRPIGERLVVYLAVCDLLYSISHVLDHSYMLAIRDNPPDAACATFAFFLNEFVLAQSLVVVFTAFNAFWMVVRQKKIGLGSRDWKLLTFALGVPAAVGAVAIGTEHFGPGGMWCYVDLRRDLGPLLTNIVAVAMIITFSFNVGAYGAVWLKIRQVGQTSNRNNQSSTKYHRTAQIMMLFVAVYIFQWWAYVAYAMWTLFGDDPHISVRWASVFFSNLGGVFNFIAYTLVRRNYQQGKGSTPTPSVKTLSEIPASEPGHVSSNSSMAQISETNTTNAYM